MDASGGGDLDVAPETGGQRVGFLALSRRLETTSLKIYIELLDGYDRILDTKISLWWILMATALLIVQIRVQALSTPHRWPLETLDI